MKLTIIKPGSAPILEIEPVTRPVVWKLHSVPPDARAAVAALLPYGGVVTFDDVVYVVSRATTFEMHETTTDLSAAIQEVAREAVGAHPADNAMEEIQRVTAEETTTE